MNPKEWKTVSIGYPRSKTRLHIETPLGVINVIAGLQNQNGQDVIAIEVIGSSIKGQESMYDRETGTLVSTYTSKVTLSFTPDVEVST